MAIEHLVYAGNAAAIATAAAAARSASQAAATAAADARAAGAPEAADAADQASLQGLAAATVCSHAPMLAVRLGILDTPGSAAFLTRR